MLKTILFKIALSLWFVAWTPIFLLGLVSAGLTRWLVLKCAGGVLVLARLIVGIDYRVHYPASHSDDGIPVRPNENVRGDGRAIIAAKHASILEVAIISTTVRNCFFIIKRELMWIPIYGWCFWRMGFLAVNRGSGATNMKRLADAAAQRIRDKMILIIYPEGTRVMPGKRPKLKRGLLYIAEHLKLPILPVGTDAGLYWPKRGRMHGGTANVYFEPLLGSSATLDEISDAINRHSA